jgi:tetratricopeptide (TPR) repeat protein
MNVTLKKYYVVWLLLLVFMSSCTSYKTITIELPQKAKQELSPEIQSLLLINRTVDDSYTDLKTDSLQQLFYDKGFTTDTVIKDIQAADTMLKAMGELLFESGRYDVVIPEQRFIEHQKNAFFSASMDWSEVKSLCEAFTTDAVLSVDMFGTRVITSYNKETYYNPADNGFYSASEARMAVVYQALFKIYEPVSEKVVVREFMRDTLVWEDMAGSVNELFTNFTPVKQALTEAAIALALDFTEKISTSWYPEQRQLFTNGDDQLKLAGTYIDQGDWTAAIDIWTNLATESTSKSIKSKALYNLAVAAEIQGDLDKAISLGVESYNTMYQQLTYDYLERLKYRKRELEKQSQ